MSQSSRTRGCRRASSGDLCTARPSDQQEILLDQEIKANVQEENHRMGLPGTQVGKRSITSGPEPLFPRACGSGEGATFPVSG